MSRASLLILLLLAGCSSNPTRTNMDVVKHDMEVCREIGGTPLVLWGFFDQYVYCDLPVTPLDKLKRAE